jgi:hypothetical protein
LAVRRVRTNEAPVIEGNYSYQGQDLFVVEALGGLRAGYFLDSGASDGMNGSNTRLLETAYGWNGVCVEPNAALFDKLHVARNCTCIQCCLYNCDGTVDFLEAAGVYGGIIEAYDPWHLQFTQQRLSEIRSDGKVPLPVRKQARTLRSVLREAGAPAIIDYWSLDTEGSELSILRSFPFDEFRFRVLTVEHNCRPVREELRQYLEGRGYTRVRDLGIDDGYVWNEDLPPRAWRSAVWRRRPGS